MKLTEHIHATGRDHPNSEEYIVFFEKEFKLLMSRVYQFEELNDFIDKTDKGKAGSIASFVAGGNIVLSYEPKDKKMEEINKRETFDKANFEILKSLLEEVSPEKKLIFNPTQWV